LDLLPQNSTKGLAVQFLRRKWDIAASETIVCGDSGNDISMFIGAEKGIIVGNAKPELLQWYEENKNETLYLAQSSYAAGIIEGLKHFNYLDC
jgi:sucrose-6F-phosphate phosphohydrolase